jgi:Pectate lyase superfamily protein
MTDWSNPLSRRNWLGMASAGVIGTGLLSPVAVGGESSKDVRSTLGTRTYNIRDFGAKGDGKTLDTAAVQAAIDSCSKDGGGTVLAPRACS